MRAIFVGLAFMACGVGMADLPDGGAAGGSAGGGSAGGATAGGDAGGGDAGGAAGGTAGGSAGGSGGGSAGGAAGGSAGGAAGGTAGAGGGAGAVVGNLTAVVTYESIGLYLPRTGSITSATVRYRELGTSAVKNALPLWFDARNNELRGSILNVKAGMSYEVEVSDSAGALLARNNFTTWSATQPVGQEIVLPAMSSTTLNITQSGSATGWIVYKAAPGGSTIDMGFAPTGTADCITVRASFIIIRGLKLKNCQGSAIELFAGAHDVIIEGNDISGFGHGPGGAIAGETATIIVGDTESAAISCMGYSLSSAQKPSRITVQGNKIHDPRYGSNPWSYGHPDSANAVGFFECGGNNVYRWNDIYSTLGHFFMDGIGGSDNFTATGFPNNDSDIYGNHISEIYDDGIEAEGGNKQVRIWGNYVTNAFIGIANGTVHHGPLYVYRNITSHHASLYNPAITNPDQDVERGLYFKIGSATSTFVGGKAYYLNNTALQPSCPAGVGALRKCGIDSAMQNSAGSVAARNIEVANNVFPNFNPGHTAIGNRITNASGTFEKDLYTGTLDVTDVGGINGLATYAANIDEGLVLRTATGSGSVRATRGYFATRSGNDIGDFTLAAGSLGRGDAKVIPNVTDMYAAPDRGAHQSGTAPMKFGTALWTGTKAW